MGFSLKGLFGGGSSPKPHVVELDNATKGLITEAQNRATGATPESIAAQTTSGVNQAVEQLAPPDIEQEASRTGNDPNMMRAIQNKYRAQTSKDLSKFHGQANIEAKMKKAQMMSNAAMSSMARQQVETNNFAILAQAYQQNKAARAQTISSFINLGTTAYLMRDKPKAKNPGAEVGGNIGMNSFVSPIFGEIGGGVGNE